jgi:hypothetical protein
VYKPELVTGSLTDKDLRGGKGFVSLFFVVVEELVDDL